MNENKGAKGGRRDHRRTLLITYENKKKLEEYNEYQKELKLRQLEKEVRNIQIKTFLKTVPIIITGKTLEAIANTVTKPEPKKDESDNNLLFDNEEKKKVSSDATPKPVSIGKGIKNKSEKYQEIAIKTTNKEKEENKPLEKNQVEKKSINEQLIESKEKEISKDEIEVKVIKQQDIPIPKSKIGNEEEKEKNITNFQQIENKKIVEYYEHELKDVRRDLRNLIFEYNVLVDDSDDLYESEEASVLIDKLNVIIKKIEELKQKIKIEDNESLDDNYINDLVNEYIDEFKDKKFVDAIKDSDLYILISEKLEELDFEKDKLNSKVETRKEKLSINEEKFIELKDKYYNYDSFNNELLRFQNEQDRLLKEIEEKVANSTNVTEKIEYKVRTMTNQSRNLLRILAIQSMIPGARSAKALATAAISYMYFMKRLARPKLEKKRYKVVKITDYSKDIESNIEKLDSVATTIGKTSNKLESMIREFKVEYQEYFDYIPECRQLLNNLNKVLDSLKEKEDELKRIKDEQKKVLQINNQKVKKLDLAS